jgi:FHA domain
MIKCSECGLENMDGLDYCDGCGAKLAAADSSAAGAGAAPEAKPAEAPAAEKPAEAPAGEKPAEEAEAEAKPSEAPTGEIKPEAAAAAPEAPAAAAPGAPAAAAATFKARLSIVRGGRKGQEFLLEDGNNLVGRWDPETGAFPEVDLDADDPEAKISRKHALIRIEGGKITIEDIGSLNGTYVNRQPRLQPGNPVELKTGDEIIIGKTFLKLVVEPIS